MNEDSFPDYLISPEAKKYFELAYKHQMEGDLDKAVFFYKKSLETEKTAEAYTFLGWTYSFMGKYQMAIDECLKAIDVDSDFGNPYNDIGSYYMSLGRLDDAVLWLKKAKKAKVYELKGLFFEAMEEYREALKVNSSYQPAKSALGRLEALLN